MRVVGGSAGGVPLFIPKTDLRPTMDMVKNAIFNSLVEFTPGARVLDLFAGAGGLGIEALSRGAASCVFVESDRRACETIRRNLEKTKLQGGEIIPGDAMRWLAKNVAQFDIILADPPYAKADGDRDFAAELMGSGALPSALKEDGVFILEHMPDAPLPGTAIWQSVREKRYGATMVTFFRRAA